MKIHRLSLLDHLRIGLLGPRTRRMRAVLSGLGIALGIAAVVAITGISSSNQQHLMDRLDKLGSNLITVGPGKDTAGKPAPLPPESVSMLGRVGPVEQASATLGTDAHVYTNDLVPDGETNSIAVLAARPDLLDSLRATVAQGKWLDPGLGDLPLVVLGSEAAARLGVDEPGRQVWLGGRWFAVTGILDPTGLAPEIDTAALVGEGVALKTLGATGSPATVYLRADPDQIASVQAVAGATANPKDPQLVGVSRPSDLLAARAEADDTMSGLVLALAGVALLVGGVGIANTMVVAVLERRGEVGLRRALGARKGQIAGQFVIEAVFLGLFGGLVGLGLGAATVSVYALAQGWSVVVPTYALIGGPLTSVAVGAIAGLYPALRAASLSPTTALRAV